MFAFMMPWGFGAAHLVAGKGKEAMETSLVMIGSGPLRPAFGPLIALAWLLHQPHVTSVIVDAKRIEQLDDNVGTTEVVLTADDIAALNAVSKIAPEYPTWMQRIREVPPKPPLSTNSGRHGLKSDWRSPPLPPIRRGRQHP
jgi:hypothetical protein